MEKICSQVAEKCLKEIKKEENRKQIEEDVLDPMVKYIGQRLYPFVIAVSVMLCVTLMTVMYLLHLSVRLQGRK